MKFPGRLKRVIGGQPEKSDDAPQAFPAGAFYSPVVNASEVLAPPEVGRIWPSEPADPAGIDMRAVKQLALLQELAGHQFAPGTGPEPRYEPDNDQFPLQDAAVLYAMVRNLRPSRLVEIGCGWSTLVTAAAIRDGTLSTELTCIEPYPRPFLSEVGEIAQLRQEKVEHTPDAVFDALQAGDVMCIDSSHVVKTGSDVVHQLLEIVPRLAPGVVVHVHDIFIPEDYPQGWVRAGFGWNEQYLLQAYLSGNANAHVLACNHWLALRHPEAVREAFGPMELNGSSIWFLTGPEPG